MRFATEIRQFINSKMQANPNLHHLFYLACIAGAIHFKKERAVFYTNNRELAKVIKQVSYQLHGEAPAHKDSERSTLTWEGELLLKMKQERDVFLLTNPIELAQQLQSAVSQNKQEICQLPYTNCTDPIAIVRGLLCGLYLACGSVAEPEERYHLEFSLTTRRALLWFGLFLECIDLVPGSVERNHSEVLYLKEVAHISSFLQLICAHHLMLKVEELRVQRDMNNHINRVVNCDNANLQRQANSAATQLADIRLIKQQSDWQKLESSLVQLMNLREEQPELSLRELGALVDPPLGKSAVNHRFNKLRKLAQQLRKEQARQSEK